MKHEIFMNFDEVGKQISPKVADIFIYHNYCAIKYKDHVISEYVKDGKYHYLVEGEVSDMSKFIAVCGDDMEGTEDEDGNVTITDGNVIAGFDAYGRLRYLDQQEPTNQNATMRAVEALDEKYGNAIPIFGGAIFVHNIEDIIHTLPHVIHSAKFFKWHDTPANACRTFCHLCFTDPALVECAIGMKFEKLTEEI